MAKLKDIADITGFSVATVSRVLNHDNSFNVSEKTRMKVLKAAEKLNYITLSQRQKKRVVIGLAYWYSSADEVIDSHYLSIRSAIEEHCDANEIDLKLFYLHEKSHEDMTRTKLDGLIALGKYSTEEIAALGRLNANFVLVDCDTTNPEIDVVMVDLEAATKNVIDYLFESGISSVGFIGGIESTIDGKVVEDIRFETFIKHEDIDYDAVYLGRLTPESGYTIMNNIIKSDNLKSAYIVATDVIAIGCLRALSEHNIKIPEEVSIVSYNNIFLSEYLVPSLTTVDLNADQLGIAAVEMMLERIRNDRKIARKTFIPTKLIKRETSF